MNFALLQVVVAVTPDGRADAVQTVPLAPDGHSETCFVLPLEETMPFEEFAAHLQQQQQNPSQAYSKCSADPSAQSPGSCLPSSSLLTSKQDPVRPYSKGMAACESIPARQDPHSSNSGSSVDRREELAKGLESSISHAGIHVKQGGKQHLQPSAEGQQHGVDLNEAACQSASCHPDTSSLVKSEGNLASTADFAVGPAETGQAKKEGQAEILYLQQQNSNLAAPEFRQLHRDVELDMPWANEIFGGSPDASNLWIGNDCSTTSFHKDHYENLFAVVAGEKRFILLPPCDVYRLYMQDYPVAQVERSNRHLQVRLSEPISNVKWTPVDPFRPVSSDVRARHPLFYGNDLPQPFQVDVQPGDLLYLPSLWLHAVAQTPDEEHKVVAVNFWYDMKFDLKFAYYGLVETLVEEARDMAA